MLSGKSLTQKTTGHLMYVNEKLRIGKSIKVESRFLAARSQGNANQEVNMGSGFLGVRKMF